MFVIPLQHPLVQLVGLRGNAFLVPFLLVGGWFERRNAVRLALWLATLNLTAFAFALAEYKMGVPAFFPKNSVTEIIYNSNDIAGYTAYRIPACFSNAHSYGGAMVMSLPWLVGAWVQAGRRFFQHILLGASVAASLLGVFMCGARLPVVMLLFLLCVTLFSGRLRGAHWLGCILIVAAIGYVVSGEERFQRFTTLENTEMVTDRVAGSVNMSFIELLVRYPLGNGMGAGGTSMPYFLQGLVRDPVAIENEYGRILLELGLPGLLLWAAFIGWTIMKRPCDPRDPWLLGKQLLWYTALTSFAVCLIGTGMLTSIPNTPLLFLSIGFLTTPQANLRRARASKANAVPVRAPASTAADSGVDFMNATGFPAEMFHTRPSSSWRALNLAELGRCRKILWFLDPGRVDWTSIGAA